MAVIQSMAGEWHGRRAQWTAGLRIAQGPACRQQLSSSRRTWAAAR